MKKQTWYHNLGFFSNPFSIKPSAFHDEIEANASLIEEINNKIDDSNMLLIYGEYGTGKTSVLKKIINEFRGKKRVIYYNCNQKSELIDFDKLLIGAGGFFSRLFRIKKKNRILLLDESLDLEKEDIETVKQYFDDDYFKSVIFVSKIEDIKLIKDIENLVGRNKYLIKGLDKSDALKLVRKRIGELDFISDSQITKIFLRNRNPRAFLKNCEEICRYAYEQGADKVKDEHIKKVLGI